MTVGTETVGAMIDVKVDETGRVSEAIEVATDASTNAVRVAGTTGIETTSEPSTTGPALNATTPISPDARSATGAKPRGPAAVSATTEGTLIGALGTTTGVSETTVAIGTTTEVSETTGAVGTRVETAVRNVTPSTTTIGRALNATTRTFLSGMHATAVKPHDPAAVASGTAPRAPEEVGNATTVVSKVAVNKAGRKVAVNKAGRKVAVVTISAVGDRCNVVALPMVHFEGPRANGPAMHTTAHPEISERRAPLSERKTERT